MTTNRDWYTMAEAAKKLGVSRQRLHQIVNEMQVKTTPINKRLTVIAGKDLQELLKKRTSSRNSA